MKKPLGVTLLGVFLVLSTCILAATTVTFLFPGTVVDHIWDFKRTEYEQMLPYRLWAGTGFLLLGVIMALAAYGWFKARRWAWWLVQGIFLANGLGDVGRALSGDVVGGLVGVLIVSALLVYVRSKGVRVLYMEQKVA
ncbi:MAG: hypothetical protein IPO17_06775 [Flavobacteriales bacterium]|nr:hypothetical protein [Flavobacteriales bacterium]MBK9194684.1 hypothetical protein [Flavobacteriales bacterium]